MVTANERENKTTPNSILYSPEGPEGLQDSAQEFNTQYDLEKVEITCIPYQWKIHFQVWSVRCRLCWLHESTPISTCGGTQAINNRQPRKGRAWKGSRDHYKQFQNPKKVSGQTRLLYL